MAFSTHLLNGFELLYKRVDEVLISTNEMGKFFKNLSVVESDFAKNLAKLNQTSSGLVFKSTSKANTKEIGTLKDCYDQILQELENESTRRAQYSLQIGREVADALANFAKEKIADQKRLVTEGRKMTKEYQDVLDALKKAKASYYSKCKEAESAQAQYEKAKTEGTVKPKDLNKLSSKASKALDAATLADNEYKKTIKKANSKQAKFFELEMPTHLKEFQHFEENRIAFLKKTFNTFIAFQAEMSPFFQQSVEVLKRASENVSVETDIRTFAEENRTNFAPPAELPYEPYTWENASLAAASAQAVAFPSNENHPAVVAAANRDFAAPVKKFDPSTKTYGLTAEEDRTMAPADKIKKLKDQMTEIKEDLHSEIHSKKGLEKLVKFYSSDPAAQDKAKSELEDQNKKISFLKDARSKVLAKLHEFGDHTADDFAVEDALEEADAPMTAICKARGLYDYAASNETELSFAEGDILTITEQDESGWWYAELRGNVGFIPRNYVDTV